MLGIVLFPVSVSTYSRYEILGTSISGLRIRHDTVLAEQMSPNQATCIAIVDTEVPLLLLIWRGASAPHTARPLGRNYPTPA